MIKKVIIIIIFSFSLMNVFASNDSTSNTVNYGFNKVINNMEFFGTTDIKEFSSLGDISWKMDYLGLSTMPNIDFRDNFRSNFIYNLPTYGITSLKFKQSINYYGEEQFTGESLPFNQLMENQGLAGIGLNLNKKNFINAYYGLEYHKQSGYISQGSTIFTDMNFSQNFFGYQLNVSADHIDSDRSYERDYKRSNLNSQISTSFDANNRMNLNVNFYSLLNDIVQRSEELELFPDVETRREKRYDLDLGFDYLVTDNIIARSRLVYGSNQFQERHRIYDVNSPRTGVSEKRNESDYLFTNSFIYKTKTTLHNLAIQLEYLENDFEIVNHDLTNPIEIQSLEESAFNRDKTNQNTLISYNGSYRFSSTDRFTTALSYSIYREDTPSDKENSDNDVQNINGSMIYSKRLSQEFEMNFAVSSRYQHFVYLKQEFSSGNFTQRSLKFNPFFSYELKNIRWYPDLQIAVEYLSFDFKTRLGEVRGNAKRHMFYKDSLIVDISKDFYTRLESQFHYRETGNFNWEEFTQTITDEKTELFSKLMVFNRYNDKLHFGLGARFYRLKDTREGLQIRSISPETDISYKLGNAYFELRGWYEFQFNNFQYRTIPNLYLNTYISF